MTAYKTLATTVLMITAKLLAPESRQSTGRACKWHLVAYLDHSLSQSTRLPPFLSPARATTATLSFDLLLSAACRDMRR